MVSGRGSVFGVLMGKPGFQCEALEALRLQEKDMGSVADELGRRDPFDDPRLRRSEELAFFADVKERKGFTLEAHQDFAEAARLGLEGALEVDADLPRTRSVLAFVVAALFVRAGRSDLAVDAAKRFLVEPSALTVEGAEKLQRFVSSFERVIQ
jgi:hypothetical protein